MSYTKWSQQEIETLKTLWGTMTSVCLAEKMGRSRQSIGYMRSRLGLPPCRGITSLDGRFFSFEDVQYLRENYHNLPIKEIAYALGRSPISIRMKAAKLNLPPRVCGRDRLLNSMTAQLGEPLLDKITALKMPRKVLARHVGAESLHQLNAVINHLRKHSK